MKCFIIPAKVVEELPSELKRYFSNGDKREKDMSTNTWIIIAHSVTDYSLG